jgi:hypothetical protein
MRAQKIIESSLLRLKWLVAAANFERAMRKHALALKYSPDQPRDDHGRWTLDGGSSTGMVQVADNQPHSQIGVSQATTNRETARPEGQDIEARIKHLFAAGPKTYQRCLDLCYPLLERFQLPGVDYNKYDFHKCMDACQREK